jgi:Actin-like ATPase involved in cell morphogenesis
MAKKIFGIDIGTSMIKVYKKDEGIVLNEKNVIAVANRKSIIAVGNEAYDMFEKAPINIHVSFPVKNGVIADIANMEALLNRFLKKLTQNRSGAEFIIAVPTDITEVEKRAFYDLILNANIKAKSIRMVEKPIAVALGIGLDITNAHGVMTVDIGADTTEVSIMSLGGIVLSKLIPIGGKNLDESIKAFVKKKYNLVIGNKTAETIKKSLASAVPIEEETVTVYGRNVVSGLPAEMEISSSMVYEAVQEHFYTIIDSIKIILERTPPEISSDIIDSGIYISGGSAYIRNLDKLIAEQTDLTINICNVPENSVVNGLGNIIEDPAFSSLAYLPKQPGIVTRRK